MRGGWVYILASRYRGTLYIGVTSNIAARGHQHREGTGEPHATIVEAITRENVLKKWKRDWKTRLIEEG